MNVSWQTAVKKIKHAAEMAHYRAELKLSEVDWARLVVVDFETFYDTDYTLSKSSTSEYVRDIRFKPQMVGIKIGSKPTKIYAGPAKIKAALKAINWATHSLLCHNTQFDGFIMSHHYGIIPAMYYDTLSMARGLHSNEIGAGLDEVAQFYGRGSKLDGILMQTKGVLNWPPALIKTVTPYCAQDVDLTYEIFKDMHAKYPTDEIDLIDLTCRLFCDPVLKVDLPRVEAELKRELDKREKLFYAAVNPRDWDDDKTVLKTKLERELTGKERDMLIIKRVIGSNEKFEKILRAEGIDAPMKISPAWMKLDKDERELQIDKKWSYAFAKDDIQFVSLPEQIDLWRGKLDPNKTKDIPLISAKQDRIRELIDCRLAVKSTTNITRAQRFLIAGAKGMSLPCGYAYYRAHTGRWGGNNKMNMQNLTRGGELRLSILAPKGHQLAVADSGQIEARVNGWLWGQGDLMDAFREADEGIGRDAYCRFGDIVYKRQITKADKLERFVGKVCLGPNTIVLTNQGLKSILDVRAEDLLWDGESWVTHDGLVDQGVRTTLTYRGLSATPDHEILTERGWLEWQEVLTDRSHFQSALSSANLPSYGGTTTSQKTESRGGTALSADVLVGPSLWSTPAASKTAALRDAIAALKSRQTQNASGNIGMLCRMTSTAYACLTACRQRLAAVVTRTMPLISTMGCEASQSILYGFSTGLSSLNTFKHSLVGTNQNWSSTASTMTAGMNRATSGSPQKQSTSGISDGSKTSNSESAILKQTTPTYDLANAGPNHRFTVMSDDGPVVVHNCVLGLGFQMGPQKFQMTLAKGALGGPPVYFTLDQCQTIVQAYRRKNDKIVRGWDICKNIIEDMAAGRVGRYGPICWEKETIWLPNGMSLKYPDLRKTMDENGWDSWSYKSGDMRSKLYGGLLCENIVQALARIIVGWQMLQISRKYRVVMTTHDEVVACVKTAQAETCFRYMLKWMKTPLDWCMDIPLFAEGGFAANYSK